MRGFILKKRVAIVGAGISGLMTAYRLSESDNYDITLYDRGSALAVRKCPLVMKRTEKCAKCNSYVGGSCSIMEGVAGAGAFSDGKYNLTTEYGGWLTDFMPEDTVMKYIEQADDILTEHGANVEEYKPNDELKKYFADYDIRMLQGRVKHLGTDMNLSTMKNLVKDLHSRGISTVTDTEVIDVARDGDKFRLTTRGLLGLITYKADIVVLALGRIGNKLLLNWCQKNKIPVQDSFLDVGVRVEMPAYIWADIAPKVYEPKLVIDSRWGDKVRTFCFNHRGEVVLENTNGIITVNGHAYVQEDKKTDLSNFAILVSYKVKNPLLYGRSVAKLANAVTDGSVIVQSYKDFAERKATSEEDMKMSHTLKGAKAGNLWDCLPANVCDGIIDMMTALNKAVTGVAGNDTLLYGVEVKYYSVRPEYKNNNFEIQDDLYAIGDGAGVTRSLSQAAANGLYVADKINMKEN